MATIFEELQSTLAKQGLTPQTNVGQTWLIQKARNLRPTPSGLFADRTALRTRTMIGRMYFFFYNAKLKEVLPYWDRFPLVMPIERYDDGFLGLNFHYIPPKDRMILLRKLNQYATGSRDDEKTRLRLTYPILKATHRAYEHTPCIKRYLFHHIKSRFLEIPSTEWEIAAALPLQRFTGKQFKSSQEIWSESKEKY